LSGCRLGRGCGGLRQGRSVLAFFQQQGDGLVHLHALAAGRHQDLADLALVDGFHFHGRLVGLNLRDDVAGLHGLAFILEPLGEVALGHPARARA
jgi:hypothetical protein